MLAAMKEAVEDVISMADKYRLVTKNQPRTTREFKEAGNGKSL